MGKDAAPPPTLWDLLAEPIRHEPPATPHQPPQPTAPPAKPTSPRPQPQPQPRTSRRDRYDQLVERMRREHGVRIHRWRTSMSGCAWQVRCHDGSVTKLIQAPRPRGPMSAAIFLHEVGHHAIGLNRYKPRCLEEHMAWQWALAAMDAHGLAVTDRVRLRVQRSMRYALAKAMRRGLKRLPAELLAYLPERP